MTAKHPRKTLLVLGALGLVAMTAACSTTPKSAGYSYKYALCDQPPSIQVGTQYACIATDNDDNSWEFIIEITGDRELTVVEGKVVK
jgi:hypothetical protein